MNGQSNYITEVPWEETITIWYVHVNDSYQKICRRLKKPVRGRGPEPVLSDSEVITIALIIETFFQGHEEVGYAFVSQYLTDLFRNLIDLDRFNQRRRELVWFIEAIRRDLRDQIIDPTDRLRVADSAPVTTMTYTRGSRCKSMVGSDYFGVVTSKKGKFFGLRLHTTVTVDQLIDEWLVAPASTTDAKVLDELLLDCRDLAIMGDKAYNDAELEQRLWRKRQIQLLPLRKDNQHQQWSADIRRILGRVRHRVETVFSTLTTVFNIQRPRGRSLAGHVTRIATCVLAHTLSFFMV